MLPEAPDEGVCDDRVAPVCARLRIMLAHTSAPQEAGRKKRGHFIVTVRPRGPNKSGTPGHCKSGTAASVAGKLQSYLLSHPPKLRPIGGDGPAPFVHC